MTHFSQGDNFSTAARVLGALFYYAPDSAEASALVSALRADGWQAQWPLDQAMLFPLAARLQAEVDEPLPQARNACLSVHMRYPLRHGDLSGWIAKTCCLATLRWHFVSGCGTTASSLPCSKMSQKITLVHCCC